MKTAGLDAPSHESMHIYELHAERDAGMEDSTERDECQRLRYMQRVTQIPISPLDMAGSFGAVAVRIDQYIFLPPISRSYLTLLSELLSRSSTYLALHQDDGVLVAPDKSPWSAMSD